jgi:hypothetical protein
MSVFVQLYELFRKCVLNVFEWGQSLNNSAKLLGEHHHYDWTGLVLGLHF